MNHSPWLAQLKRARAELALERDVDFDLAVLGGGIAGVATSYFLLRDTRQSIILVEGGKIAHGATGHNAGQIVSYFERPFQSIVKEFGLEKAGHAQKSIDDAWLLLEGILRDTNLKTPLTRVTGYVGISNVETMLSFCEDIRLKRKAGIFSEDIYISDEAHIRDQVPMEYRSCVTIIAKADIKQLLETTSDEYIAVGASQKGCMNSAMFCEELVGYMLATYPNRFQVVEQTMVKEVQARLHDVVLMTASHKVTAKRVVLCTNGFEHFHIKNDVGTDIDPKFHANVHGVIGYMTGYVTPMGQRPMAVSYLPKTYAPDGDYFYLTRRPYEHGQGETHNLVCLGGPVDQLPEKKNYQPQTPVPEDKLGEMKRFTATIQGAGSLPEPSFRWHGLMGYTQNRMRLIGVEPCNANILYNLGCNGIGILPSIFGGKRIAEILSGKIVEPSAFDPRDTRCELPKHRKK